MVVRTDHLNQAWSFSSKIDGLVCSKSSNNHLCDCIEDSSFPVHVVVLHLLGRLGVISSSVVLDRALLNTLKILVSNILVVLDKFGKDLHSVVLEELGKLSDVHWVLSIELNLLDNLSIFDVDDFLLDILSVLENYVLGLLESVNGHLALFDVLVNGKREPVVVLDSFVHMSLELLDVSLHELLLNWLQIVEG